MDKATETTSLYIHVPFCRKKCPYCDFYSVPDAGHDLSEYVDLLIRHQHLLTRKPADVRPLASVFFGGGTPSLLAPADVGRILAEADRLFGLAKDVEISLEANPGTVDQQKLAGFRATGVNRLSIGVQALCDQGLHRLGRIHSSAEAEACIRAGRAAGFDNFSCDLMFALPGQSVEQLRDDLERLLAHQPEHLAIYGLSLEEGTPFSAQHESGELDLPDEETYVAGYRLLHDTLTGAGFRHYEISNFARPGFECRHNRRYWRRQPHLAVGAGAHSFRDAGWGERRAVPDDLDRYATILADGADPAETIETYDREGAMAETLYLGLRTDDGVDEAAFRRRFGAGVAETWPEAVRRCGDRLRCEAGRWRLDLDGWLLFDTLVSRFF